MEELISVIIPVYNVQMFLKKCVESVINQSYSNIEIILVDDGSTDGSGMLCDSLAVLDSRIRVFHQENKGLSAARNIGIEISIGKYIMFIDSDDYIHKQMISIMYYALKRDHTKLVFCNYQYSKEDNNLGDLAGGQDFLLSQRQVIEMYFDKQYYVEVVVAWNKLYEKSLFKDLRYPEGRLHEDEYIVFQLLNQVSQVGYVNKTLYHYRLRDGSIMNMMCEKSMIDQLDAFRTNINYMKTSGLTDFLVKETGWYLDHIILYFRQLIKCDTMHRIYLLNNFREYYNILDRRAFTYKKRIKYRLFLSFPSSFGWLYNIYKQNMYSLILSIM